MFAHAKSNFDIPVYYHITRTMQTSEPLAPFMSFHRSVGL